MNLFGVSINFVEIREKNYKFNLALIVASPSNLKVSNYTIFTIFLPAYKPGRCGLETLRASNDSHSLYSFIVLTPLHSQEFK